MIYTDGVHLVGTTVKELHEFCKAVDIKRCWFEGMRKGHPHYDLNKTNWNKIILAGVTVEMVSPKKLLQHAKSSASTRLC